MSFEDGKFTESTLAALAARGEVRRFRKGAILISEGDRNDTMFIVLSGEVKAYSVDDRDRMITYGNYGAGETIGEMSLDGGPRSASVMAVKPTTCAAITRDVLLAQIRANPEFALELMARIIRRARIATRTARNMALLDTYGRVAQLFEGMAVRRDDGRRWIEARLTHADIANRVGCSREMVSRLMKELRAGGYVVDDEGGWLLPDRPLPAHY